MKIFASLLVALFLATVRAQTYTFTTLGEAGYGNADGAGRAARFAYPTGVAVDASGNVFVADSGNHTIRKITPEGVVTTLAGAAGRRGSDDGVGSAARFSGPVGVAVDSGGNVFVADRRNHRVRKITADGRVTTLANSPVNNGGAGGVGGAEPFSDPMGVAVDDRGNVFVAAGNAIRKIAADGVVTILAGSPGSSGHNDGVGSTAQFSFPVAVAVDASGNVFVADYYNRAIRKITPTGVVTTLAVLVDMFDAEGFPLFKPFHGPQGVAVDGSGNVFVADGPAENIYVPYFPSHGGMIRKITADGVVTTLAGALESGGSTDGTGANARFNSPTGVAADRLGNVYVADRENNVIRKISASGVVNTLAGDGSYGANDVMPIVARSYAPNGVAVDDRGNVFVADTNHHTIRKINTDGTTTTLAGSPGNYGSADGAGGAARFMSPTGVAVDRRGIVFVADGENHTIRRITGDGVVTTLAGTAGRVGSADGIGAAARFNYPLDLAVDDSGNLFVSDTLNHTIRKITADGVVTTLAGEAGGLGRTDGTAAAARFQFPRGLAVDVIGNVFVADTDNGTIRKITANGIVTTLRDVARSGGRDADGTESAALFRYPRSVAVDSSGNVFVADALDNSIRKITASGIVTIAAGSGGGSGSADGTGSAAHFSYPRGVALDVSGGLYVADRDNHTIRKGIPSVIAPAVVTAPESQHLVIGAPATLTVAAAGSGLSFQWKKNGVAIPGATAYLYRLGAAAADDMGFYSVVAFGAAGTIESPVAIVTVAADATSRIGNFSARGFVPAGGDLSVGLVVRGGGGKSVLVRAVGPTLGAFGVSGVLANPSLELFASGSVGGALSNDDWGGGSTLANVFSSVGAFPLPVASKDAALLGTLAMGGHTVRVTSSVPGDSGLSLTEVYDRDEASAPGRCANISALGFVGTGTQILALGFVIEGVAPKRLLIRAIGPGLIPLGVTGVLGAPQLLLNPLGKTFSVGSNDNWGGAAALADAFALAGAFALPASSKDAALVVRLPPGGYTVAVSGIGGTTGRALVEIYDLDR